MIQPRAMTVVSAAAMGPVRKDRRGAVAIEYALIGAMVAIIAIGSLALLGDSATGLWATIGNEVGAAIGGP